MQIICKKDKLLRAMRIIETAISTKATLPILSNFLFELEPETNKQPGKLNLESTDLEIGLRYFIEAQVKSAAGLTIPAKKFGDIISELNKDDIEIVIDDESKVNIKSGKSNFLLLGTPKDEYPSLPEFDEKKSVSINKKILYDMLRKTSFAVSTEETKYNLSGVYFVIDNKSLQVVATDGRRLAYVFNNTALEGPNTQIRGIIPIKSINELIKIINLEESESSENVRFYMTENQVTFQIGNATLFSRLSEGKFPNYEHVIPKNNPTIIKVDAQELLSATKQMSLITSEKGGAVRFLLKKNLLQLSATSQGIGSGEVDIDIEYDGPGLDTAFNPGYIIDVLKNIDEKEVIFELKGPLDAAVIKPVDNKNYLCVIMPMRLT